MTTPTTSLAGTGAPTAARCALRLAVPLLVTGVLVLGPAGHAGSGGTPPATAATSVPVGALSLPHWRLDRRWEFDTLDPVHWTVRHRWANANEESFLLRRNVTVKDGTLRIQGSKERAGGRRYTSGYLDTRGRYSLPNRFRAEIRAKVPLERGMWAAPLWFRPFDHSAGEIDLVETYGHDREKFGEYRVHQTIHTGYARHRTNQKMVRFPDRPRGWHVYTIVKTKGRIQMFVDGRRSGIWEPGDPAWYDRYYSAGKRWSLITNLQIGGHRGSPDGRTDWRPRRTRMVVDYIRTWTR